VSALANQQVGEFINKNFVSSYVKVGTFALVNGQKQGGNVASYFCLPDGTVLHAIAGPTDANTFLFESRWIVDVHNRAAFVGRDNPARYTKMIRDAHAERLQTEYRISRGQINRLHDLTAQATQEEAGRFTQPRDPITSAKLQVLHSHQHIGNAGRVHLLVALFPQEKIEDVYEYVFESILKEKVSSLPVVEK
jgi:hypothetical protein